MWILDVAYRFDGFRIEWVLSLGWRFWAALPVNLFLFLNVAWYIFSSNHDRKLLLSRTLIIWVVLDFAFLGGFSGMGFLHLVIPAVIYFFWTRQIMDEKSANMLTAALIIIDFTFYGAYRYFFPAISAAEADGLIQLLTNRVLLHVWGAYVVITTSKRARNKLSNGLVLAFLFIVIFGAFSANNTTMAAEMSIASPEQRVVAWDATKAAFGNFRDTALSIPGNIKKE